MYTHTHTRNKRREKLQNKEVKCNIRVDENGILNG